jgi:hypothetical protein
MGPFFNQMMDKMYSQVDETKLSEGDKDMWREAFNEVWICNVTHVVLGEHPEAIYITGIERSDALPQLQFPNAITVPSEQIPEIKMEPFNDRPMETWVDMVDLI